MPFIFPHLALMPDAHLGKGATVGSVIPTLGAIIPAAVGVDIGCGMIAVRTQYSVEDVRQCDLSAIRQGLERSIPLSAGKYNVEMTDTAIGYAAELETRSEKADFDPAKYTPKWRLQLGTLGSGNHFIEVTADELDRVWLFLHSGSRGVGNRIAGHHIKVAQNYTAKHWISLPDPNLAYLVEGTREFSSVHGRADLGTALRIAEPAEMMDRADRGDGRTCRDGRPAGDHPVPPQLHGPGRPTGASRSGFPGRVRSTLTRVLSGSSPAAWGPRPTWWSARETRWRSARHRTVPAGSTRGRLPGGPSPTLSCGNG